jgi:hypothetical protein
LDELVDTLRDIFHEAGRDPDESQAAVNRLRGQLSAALPDALVTGWEPFESAYELPDPDDRHVLAAAVRGRADVIVTRNIKDFPSDKMPTGLDVQSPDEFLTYAVDLHPEVVLASIAEVAARTGRTGPRLSPDDVVSALERSGIKTAVQQLRHI